jgi:hypothetical protein
VAVFPDRIVLKNSTDPQATIESLIGAGGISAITQGEIVIGLEASSVSLYTLDANGGIVRFNPSSAAGRAIVSSTEPTVGLGGISLAEGDMWFDDSNDSYYVYEAGAWSQVVTTTGVASLNDIGDVDVGVMDVTKDGYILIWDDDAGNWTAASPGSTNTTSLDDLTDCTFVLGEFAPFQMEVIRWSNASGGQITFELPDPFTGNLSFTLPPSYGTSGQVLTSDGAGGMTWQDSSVTLGLNDLTDVSYLTGEFFPTEMTAIKFSDSDGDTMRFSLPAGYTGNFSFSFPPNDGDADQVLSTDGSGVMSWALPMGRAIVSATAPATNLNGGTLADGDLWFKTDDSVYYVYNSSSWVEIAGGGGGGTGTRTSQSVATSSIANEASEDVTLSNVGKAGQLVAIEVDQAAWVTVYASQAARTADASRTQIQDPEGGSGVLLEIITTGAEEILVTPSVSYFNYESIPVAELYLKVVNKSGATQTITTTITAIPSEA